MGTLSGAGFSKVALISEPYKTRMMYDKSLIYSITFHSIMIILTVLSLPFLENPLIYSIVSVELIRTQIRRTFHLHQKPER